MLIHNVNPNHPTVPPIYENETNYKKIPREYLCTRIPKGRGMIKWAPFATMPQQYTDINKKIESQTYQYMPQLSDEQIIDINMKLNYAATFKRSFEIVYFENHTFNSYKCKIIKIDYIKEEINVLVNELENKVLKMKYIIEIK